MSKTFDKYLAKQSLFQELIKEKPSNNLKLIVIIPAYNEPDILNTLNALLHCKKNKAHTEIIILFNHSEISTDAIIQQNKVSYSEVLKWAKKQNTPELKFIPVLVENLPKKHAGAGLARKIAMDEAIRRFSQVENEAGIIASLDADTLVSNNYLTDISKAFNENRKLNACTFYFEHLINDDKDINRAIETYELYLRYFKLALAHTGFPYAYHTIGSCFAVRASSYVKQGGMNRRQGGEDFYFLHKIFPLGNCKELNHIKVYPSSRPSDRVPFGTGPAIRKIIVDGEYPTYKPQYFCYLKSFFSKKTKLFKASQESINNYYYNINESIQEFIPIQEFIEKICELNANCATLDSFEKRFFQWFDAFKIIKYLNYIHEKAGRISTINAAKEFYEAYLKLNLSEFDTNEILEKYRKLESEIS